MNVLFIYLFLVAISCHRLHSPPVDVVLRVYYMLCSVSIAFTFVSLSRLFGSTAYKNFYSAFA